MSRTLQNFTLLLGTLLVLVTAPAFADRAPDWMVGTFEGHNRKTGQTVTIRMNDEGNLIVTNQKRGLNEIARNSASYRRGVLTIDRQSYRVEKTEDGFRTIERDDPDNRVNFRRIGDYNENWHGYGNRRLPDWMVGTFQGHNRKQGMTVTVRMNDRGNLIVSHRNDGHQEVARDPASYRQGLLTIDNQTYRVEKTEDGFRTILREDPNTWVNFRRIGDYNENWRSDTRNARYNGENRLPDWMIGTFEGHNRKYGQDITIRTNDRGNLVVTNRKQGRNIARNTATYRRGVLTIDNEAYRVERTNDGFRTIQRDDPDNRVDFRRIGD